MTKNHLILKKKMSIFLDEIKRTEYDSEGFI